MPIAARSIRPTPSVKVVLVPALPRCGTQPPEGRRDFRPHLDTHDIILPHQRADAAFDKVRPFATVVLFYPNGTGPDNMFLRHHCGRSFRIVPAIPKSADCLNKTLNIGGPEALFGKSTTGVIGKGKNRNLRNGLARSIVSKINITRFIDFQGPMMKDIHSNPVSREALNNVRTGLRNLYGAPPDGEAFDGLLKAIDRAVGRRLRWVY